LRVCFFSSKLLAAFELSKDAPLAQLVRATDS
jgi:hypothetical protein